MHHYNNRFIIFSLRSAFLLWFMDAICSEKDFRLGQLSILEITMVAKMKLIYPPTITYMGRTIMCISYPRIKWVGITINEQRDESNLGRRQMGNTNRKCWFSSRSSSRLLWTQLNAPYNCPFFHIVYLPWTSHKVLLNHYAAFCLDKFWAEGTSSHKCHKRNNVKW